MFLSEKVAGNIQHLQFPQYEFISAPFGLCNSPAVFQKFINAVFKGLIVTGHVLTYMDDLIVPSTDFSSGVENPKWALRVASEHGLSVNSSKCHFLQTRVKYLGHIMRTVTFSHRSTRPRLPHFRDTVAYGCVQRGI